MRGRIIRSFLKAVRHFYRHDKASASVVEVGSVCGLYDDYIIKYMKIKQNSTGDARTEAKLFLNKCFGKPTSDDSRYQKLFLYVDTDSVHMLNVKPISHQKIWKCGRKKFKKLDF